MQHVVYILLRRMRLPLIILISTYAISIVILTLIPGVDDQGNPWRMDFFHAIYFVSFLGSTIGFGEIPYAFTDAQRMWTTVIIYATVVAWLYAIGSLLGIIQDQSLRKFIQRGSFVRKVKRSPDPFYLVCGYGGAANMLVGELAERGIKCVVVERDQEKISALEVQDLREYVPALCADATDPDNLLAAGLKHPKCRGVIALTGDDGANLTIAISSKLLTPQLPVICQSETADTAANMASFGTDHIIDPFEIFASRFAMMFHSPSMHLVYEWITAPHHTALSDFRNPPTGTWILCGYGRFGKAIHKHLSMEGVPMRFIEADIAGTGAPEGTFEGRGTEADTLIAAAVQYTAGIIAGTDDDANNLSILLTAKDLKADLFTVCRQNRKNKNMIFGAADVDLIMHPDTIVARHALSLITAPLLDDFLQLANCENDEWANVLVSRVAGVVEDLSPETWDLTISLTDAPAALHCLVEYMQVTLGNICCDPADREHTLPCVPLLIKRESGQILLPEMDEPLQAGDRILFCGHEQAASRIRQLVHDHRALEYVRTGIDRPSGLLWHWLTKHRQAS